MTVTLETLLAEVRKIRLSDKDLRAQRLSFAYGNTHIENPLITREMIERADTEVTRQNAAAVLPVK